MNMETKVELLTKQLEKKRNEIIETQLKLDSMIKEHELLESKIWLENIRQQHKILVERFPDDYHFLRDT